MSSIKVVRYPVRLIDVYRHSQPDRQTDKQAKMKDGQKDRHSEPINCCTPPVRVLGLDQVTSVLTRATVTLASYPGPVFVTSSNNTW